MVLRTPLEAALYVIVEGFTGRHIGNGAPAHLVGDRVEGEVGVYGRRPVPDQTGHVMNGPRFSRLHYEADVRAQFLVHQEMVDGGHQQQRRYGHGIGVRMPVRKDDHTGPAQDGIFDLSTDVVKGVAQSLSGARLVPWPRTGRRRQSCASRGRARPRPRTAGWPVRRS